MSTANDVRRWLFLAQRTVGDVNAIARGRLWQRIWNRVAGRLINKASRGVWR